MNLKNLISDQNEQEFDKLANSNNTAKNWNNSRKWKVNANAIEAGLREFITQHKICMVCLQYHIFDRSWSSKSRVSRFPSFTFLGFQLLSILHR